MKKSTFALTMLLLVAIGYAANSKTIVNPYYEFRNTGIYSISEIQLTDSATYISVHSDFIPRWWVMFSDTISIRDIETGNKYKVRDIQGAVFNELLWMPESGDSTVVLVFPPLPASVKQIDYHNYIYGISLDNNKAGTRAQTSMLPDVDIWIDAELAKSTQKPLKDYQSDDFFNDTPARLIGCIKGYDPRAGFTTGIIYGSNELTREDFPIVAQIQPDGRFEVEIPMIMPQITAVLFNNHWVISFYLEPGQTMAMILDWDEILVADRKRNTRYQFQDIEFRGALASLNHELINIPEDDFNYNLFAEKVKTLAPLDFKKDSEKELAGKMEQLETHFAENQLSEKTQTILRNSIIVANAARLFDYEMYRRHYAREDTVNEILKMPIPDSYYEFLQNFNLNDQSLLLTREFSTFINRFEYCSLFDKARSIAAQKSNIINAPEKTLLDYFIEAGVQLSEEEIKHLQLIGKTELTDDDRNTLKDMKDCSEQFNTKHSELIQNWANQYIAPLHKVSLGKMEMEVWKAKDSLLMHDLGLKPNLAYEIAKVRSLKYSFSKFETKVNAIEFWSQLKQGIQTPYLVKTGDRMLHEAFPNVEIAATPLPEGIGTEIFMKIIEPHKGKLLFVDFWATTCGPCLSGIRSTKHLREKFAGNSDFTFVFITDVRSSPENHYNDFVKEQELTNIYRIPQDEFNYLRQLFKFNGIPRYVVIDSNGHVINDNFRMHNFESELARLLPQYQQ
jgi:thiol-disulfide isomerase/thioredoxin